MSFNTWIFLFVFLPLSLIGYFVLAKLNNKRIAIYYLIGANMFFYGYANIRYLYYFLGCIIVNYLIIKKIIRFKSKKWSILGIALNLCALAILKYTNFFLSTLNMAFKANFNLVKLFLPLGISFFTFQFIALIYDSWKGRITEIDFTQYLLFASFFPKITQGPIMLYQDFSEQYKKNEIYTFQIDNFAKGVYALAIGMSKKILIADVLGKLVDSGFGGELYSYNSGMLIILALCYTLQIYFDFSGYSDMAIGIALMFNVKLPQNFNSPYKAKSINSFWERWHMSLTRFFTKYLYIPLGGNRCGEKRTYFNVFIVFFLSGLWHGANYTFLVWGIMHGIFSIVERRFKITEKMYDVVSWIYTFGFINISWIFFRANTLGDALFVVKGILKCDFRGIDNNVLSTLILPEIEILFDVLNIEQYLYIFPFVFLIVLIIIILDGKNTNEKLMQFKPTGLKALTTIILLSWSVLSFGNTVSFLYEMF